MVYIDEITDYSLTDDGIILKYRHDLYKTYAQDFEIFVSFNKNIKFKYFDENSELITFEDSGVDELKRYKFGNKLYMVFLYLNEQFECDYRNEEDFYDIDDCDIIIPQFQIEIDLVCRSVRNINLDDIPEFIYNEECITLLHDSETLILNEFQSSLSNLFKTLLGEGLHTYQINFPKKFQEFMDMIDEYKSEYTFDNYVEVISSKFSDKDLKLILETADELQMELISQMIRT